MAGKATYAAIFACLGLLPSQAAAQDTVESLSIEYARCIGVLDVNRAHQEGSSLLSPRRIAIAELTKVSALNGAPSMENLTQQLDEAVLDANEAKQSDRLTTLASDCEDTVMKIRSGDLHYLSMHAQ